MKMIFRNYQQSRIDIMDDDLACLRLWRKPIAKDDCSLYRAISEQLFLSQVYHEEIRIKVRSFIDKNHDKLKSEWTTRVEFLAISHLFRCDIIVYQFGRPPIDLTQNNFLKKVHLCVSGGSHYDCVYPYIYKEIAALCQSILYDILYRKVFKVGDDVIKQGLDILHCKQYHRNKKFNDRDSGFQSSGSYDSRKSSPCRDLPPHPPFPYRVAKALDPVIYRNVEYDNWVDSVKDSAADLEPTFQPGDKCQVILENEEDKVYYAHIQEMSPSKGPVTVFIEELGEKHTVEYDSLRPVPQPSRLDSKRRGRKKDQFFLPFSRSGMVLGMKVEQSETDQDNREMSPPNRGKRVLTGSHDTGRYNDGTWYRSKPKQILNSLGHPIKVKWHGLTFNYPRDNGNRQYSGFNKNHGGRYHSSPRDEMGGNRYHNEEKSHMYPRSSAGQSCREYRSDHDYQDRRKNYTPPPRQDRPAKKESFADCPDSQNNKYNYQPQPQPSYTISSEQLMAPIPGMVTSTPMMQPFPEQMMHPPPAQITTLPPQTYGGSPISNPLSMYPYVVLPPVGGSSPVDYTFGPSQDPSGNDLPISDPNTLRYFYNLGYECHRLSNLHLGQSPQVPPPCLPPFSGAPFMIPGSPCPPEDFLYAEEYGDMEMAPGVLLTNEWNDQGEMPPCGPGEFILAPPNCPGNFAIPPPPQTGRLMNCSNPIPIPNMAPPAMNSQIYTGPMPWNTIPVHMPPPTVMQSSAPVTVCEM